MYRIKVVRELIDARDILGSIETAAIVEGMDGLEAGMSKIRKEIQEWEDIIENASNTSFPEEG